MSGKKNQDGVQLGIVSEVFLEAWARDLLVETNHVFRDPRLNKVKVTEWLPESLIDAQPIDMQVPTSGNLQPQMTKEKTWIDFDYVLCIGGDGTLLRLLRVLFVRCQPPTLPKIITVSMGSLNYLSNFRIEEC